MEFPPPKPKRQTEPALPMINVVFLLLIFFLMSAQITTPPPFEVALPSAEIGDQVPSEITVHLSAEGTLAVAGATGAEALETLSARADANNAKVLIRADESLPAAELAKLLSQLGAMGLKDISLATVPQ
ncbi:MAG: biopolymer transporter ExbD [Pseudomonadota bacterium]